MDCNEKLIAMNSFDAQVLKQIIENESDPKKIPNFLTNDFCNELLKCRKNIQKKMVDREKAQNFLLIGMIILFLKNLEEN